ncbi:MAG: P-loop NTPase, partial [Novibacillus thermophilus]
MAGGEVWAVVGPKGGVGKTTIAANLAVALNRPVGLVDLDVPFANMASLFRYKPTFTWEDWDPEDSIVRRSNRIRENVYLMSAQNEPNMKPKSPLVEKAIDGIEAMRRECGFVIVDNGSWLSDYLEEVCRLANRILLVTTPDQMSIINSLNFLKWIDNQEAQVDIVLNRSSRKLPYKVSELEEVTGCPVSMVLPETPKVTRLSWQGKLMVEVKKRHAWSKEIYQ